MAGIYARTIEVRRLKTVAGSTDAAIGNVGYSGAEQSLTSAAGETVIATGLPASIQAGAVGRRKANILPQDVVYAPTWNIFIPAANAPKGTVRDRDIIYDDEGYRYEVGQNYWNILGYKLVCIRLEA